MRLDKVVILIKKATLEFDKISNLTLHKYDISNAQYKIIKYIYSEYKNGVRLVDLENCFSITHPTAISLVKNLEKKELIEYKDNPNHARSRLIYPTKKALRFQKELENVGEELENEATRNLTKSERQQLIELLRKMLGIKNG